MQKPPISSARRHAFTLIELLVAARPFSAAELRRYYEVGRP
jgi:hypothetical protein